MNNLLQAIKNHIEQTLTNQLEHTNDIHYAIKAISTAKPRKNQADYIHYRINNDKQHISCFLWIYKDLSIIIKTICGEKGLTLEGKEQVGHEPSYEITKAIPNITLTLNEPHSLDTVAAITQENIEIIQNPKTLRAIIVEGLLDLKSPDVVILKQTKKALKQEPHKNKTQ